MMTFMTARIIFRCMLLSLLCVYTVTYAEYAQYEADNSDSQYDSPASEQAYQREQAESDAENAEAWESARRQWIHQQAVEAHREGMQAMREQREQQRQKIIDNVMAHSRQKQEEALKVTNFPGISENGRQLPSASSNAVVQTPPAGTVAHPWVVVIVLFMLLAAVLWWWLDRQKTSATVTQKRPTRVRNNP